MQVSPMCSYSTGERKPDVYTDNKWESFNFFTYMLIVYNARNSEYFTIMKNMQQGECGSNHLSACHHLSALIWRQSAEDRGPKFKKKESGRSKKGHEVRGRSAGL